MPDDGTLRSHRENPGLSSAELGALLRIFPEKLLRRVEKSPF
jgi:hypothetical protein